LKKIILNNFNAVVHMKKDILTLFIIIMSLSVGAQVCTEQAFGFGNNQFISSYNVSGDVELVFDAQNAQLTLNLGSNYSTANGPDVRAYLVKSGGLSDIALTSTPIANLENIQFGLTAPSGAQTFTIAAPSDIDEFDKVFFYCLQFDQFWDFGTINPFPKEGCLLSSTGSLAFNAVDIYPNPASKFVNVSANDSANDNGEVAIYSIIGQQLMRYEGILNQTIDISGLQDGVYSIQVSLDGNTLTKKLVVRQ